MDDDLPDAVPAFVEHFTDPVYSDESDEFAPFGSDEGNDMLYEWADRRDELGPDTMVADLIEDSGFTGVALALEVPEEPGVPGPGGQVDAATITIGAAFTLLRLAGHVDEGGRHQALKALNVLLRFYGPQPQLIRQRDDLTSWTQ